MKIKVSQSLQGSRKLLDTIAKLVPKEFNEYLTVVAYNNGQESGYGLCRYFAGHEFKNPHADNAERKVCFAKHQHSNQLVVYKGLSSEFTLFGNISQNKPVYFDSDDYEGAAKFILEFLFPFHIAENPGKYVHALPTDKIKECLSYFIKDSLLCDNQARHIESKPLTKFVLEKPETDDDNQVLNITATTPENTVGRKRKFKLKLIEVTSFNKGE